ncbi:hypothetical protein CU098_001907 [Rhizopus stolonifer]|uniref:F-box domain-containing protein n=1 Tax=Rhizopus stolonifer TaxID=4846 RepID=A0A367K8K2_RHIST|nr:hypothetical protein CU098_001907 [Rhizopus stolonifer]
MNVTKIIPTEILLHIVSHLTPHDTRIGLTICQDWFEVFRHALYYKITLKSLYQFHCLCESLRLSQQKLPNGHLVKHLVVRKAKPFSCLQKRQLESIIPRLCFESLVALCPYLESLEIDPDSWKSITGHNDIARWKYMHKIPTLASLDQALLSLQCLGKGLTSVSIQGNIIVDMSTQNRLLSIFSLTPYLEELAINDSDMDPALSLTLQDIETIHSLLPKLRRFHIIGNNIQMPIDSNEAILSQIAAYPIVANLEYLHWETRHTPAFWLFYIAHKYPNLLTLELDVHYTNSTDNFQLEKSFFLNLVQKCRYIEQLSLSCPILDHWLNESFLNIAKNNRCIRQITPLLRKGNRIKSETELEFIAHHTGHLMTSLEIEQWRFNVKLPYTLHLLKRFACLSSLDIKCDSYHNEYDLQYLLDNCPTLETLILEWGMLYVPIVFSKKRYRLKVLQMTFMAFVPHFFDFLSLTCPSLKTFSLTRCKQLCEMNDMVSQTTVILNMPHHKFESLVLDGIRLDYSSASMFYHGLSSYIRIAYIEQAESKSWHQHVGYQNNNRDLPLMQELSTKEAFVTQKYFAQRKQGSFVDSSKLFLRNLSEQKVSDVLRTNLMFGYLKIQCKQLNHFVLDGNVNCPHLQ